MKNIALLISYVGTDFHGWQRQTNSVSIQEWIEKVIFTVTQEHCSVVGCGRTDAGVHAKNYVCNFYTNTSLAPEHLPVALNTYLPRSIRVERAWYEPLSFHATKSAVKKTYCYRIYNSRIADPFYDPFTWQFSYPMDLEKMKMAASQILGKHDFSSFMSSGSDILDTVRTIYSLEVQKEGPVITISVTADGFLYNMVRIIAGTLAYIGAGKMDSSSIPEIIRSKNRLLAGPTAPAKGLMLSYVVYGGDAK